MVLTILMIDATVPVGGDRKTLANFRHVSLKRNVEFK